MWRSVLFLGYNINSATLDGTIYLTIIGHFWQCYLNKTCLERKWIEHNGRIICGHIISWYADFTLLFNLHCVNFLVARVLRCRHFQAVGWLSLAYIWCQTSGVTLLPWIGADLPAWKWGSVHSHSRCFLSPLYDQYTFTQMSDKDFLG